MTRQDQPFLVRRIVVALESGCENLQALELAAELAARARAELHGIFVDDEHLLRLAALPFSRQTSLHAAASLPLELADVEAELRALARRAQRSLEEVAARLRVPWSFETVRGDRSSVMSATQGSDVLVVETTTRPFARHMRMPTEWSEIAIRGERACLLASPARGKRKGVLVVHDGSEAGERALAAALALDGGPQGGMTIASLASATENATLRRRLHELGIDARIEPIGAADLARTITAASRDLLVLPIALVAKHYAELHRLLAAPSCAVLLVN